MSGHSKTAVLRLALAIILIMAFAVYAESSIDEFYKSRTPLNIRCLDGNGDNLRLTNPPKIAHVTRCAKITFDSSASKTVNIHGKNFKFRKILKINGKDVSSIDAVNECNNVYALAYDDSTGRNYFSNSKPSGCGNNKGELRPADSGNNGGNGNKNAGSGMVQNPYGGCKNNNPEAGQKDMFCYRNVAFGWVEWGKYFTGCAPNSVVIIPVRQGSDYELYAVTNKNFKDLINGDMQEWIFSGATIAGKSGDVVNGKQLYVDVVERMKCENEDVGVPCGNGYTVWKIKKEKDDGKWGENDLKNKQIRFFSCGARVDGYTPNSNAYDYTELEMCNMWWGKLEEGDRVNDVCKDARDKGRCICENHYRMACRSCYIASFGNSIETKCDGKSGEELYQCLFDESAKVQMLDDSKLGFPRDYVDCNGKCKVSGGGSDGAGGNGGNGNNGGNDRCAKPFHPPVVKWFRLKQGSDGKAVLEIEVDHDNAWGCGNDKSSKLVINNGEKHGISLGDKKEIQLNNPIGHYIGLTFRIELENGGKRALTSWYSLGDIASSNREERINVPDVVEIKESSQNVEDSGATPLLVNYYIGLKNIRLPGNTKSLRAYFVSETKPLSNYGKCNDNEEIDCYIEPKINENKADIIKNVPNTAKKIRIVLVAVLNDGKVVERGVYAIKTDTTGYNSERFNKIYSKYFWGETDMVVECKDRRQLKPTVAIFFEFSNDGTVKIVRGVSAKHNGGVVVFTNKNDCELHYKINQRDDSDSSVVLGNGIYYIPSKTDAKVIPNGNYDDLCSRKIENGMMSNMEHYVFIKDTPATNDEYMLMSKRWVYEGGNCKEDEPNSKSYVFVISPK